MIAICAVICGAGSWKDMELFGNERLEWVRQFMDSVTTQGSRELWLFTQGPFGLVCDCPEELVMTLLLVKLPAPETQSFEKEAMPIKSQLINQ
jgi:hypothetical protein